ncbi:MAG TPA: ABC transporter ATP-binding protein [Thermoanaerobaculia bacterium]|jgi:oligopeptide/dipeptide ABC transporter ATP-binding protein
MTAASSGEPLLEAVALTRVYPLRRGVFGGVVGRVRAVDGVSLAIARGETLGLVGESGSGKSTTARLLLRLEDPASGQIRFDGEDWLALKGAALARKRRDVQMVFQDPATSLNPRMTAGDQIGEPLLVQRLARGPERRRRVAEVLAEVGLPAETERRFPSDLSGGERQRVAIARALATRPKLLVCDEPVSALDVSVAAQVVNLLADLRDRTGLSALFISHDLAIVARVADRVAVMYCGRIVEEGPLADVLGRPLHPYTAALLAASVAGAGGALAGEAPSPAQPPPGCSFHPRCPIARARCREESPALADHLPGHRAACFYAGEALPGASPEVPSSSV